MNQSAANEITPTDLNYRITLTYIGPGDTTIVTQSATTPSRTTADHIVTQLFKLLVDNTWRFSLIHQTDADATKSAPPQPSPRSQAKPPTAEPIDEALPEGPTTTIPF